MPGDLPARIDVRNIHTASSRIAGLSVFTWIEALRFLAHAPSIRSLYIRRCAEFLNAAPRSNKSGIQQLTQSELRAVFGEERLEPVEAPFTVGIQASYMCHSEGLQSEPKNNMTWIESAYGRPLEWTGVSRAGVFSSLMR